ncbi:acyl carrier protein [Catenuloplanes indicus]|uniref:Acyl carrier protein n=1 Tax=Catenuloplanes indicus TaxID=137267 RepID=A0AAE3VVD0_9ACTN|nr:acyl carrier protein [Catenuloplanes indicus]MDQ0363892.1 acyl carrier protein [Catenuloplanes indicus]
MTEQTTSVPEKEELRRIIAETLEADVEEITDDANFVDDLEVDSLMALEITVRLEKRYGISLDESEMRGVSSLNGTYKLLLDKLAS